MDLLVRLLAFPALMSFAMICAAADEARMPGIESRTSDTSLVTILAIRK